MNYLRKYNHLYIPHMLTDKVDILHSLVTESIDSHIQSIKQKKPNHTKSAAELRRSLSDVISGQVEQIYFKTMKPSHPKVDEKFSHKLVEFLTNNVLKRLGLEKKRILQLALLTHNVNTIDSNLVYSSLGEQVVHLDQYISNSVVIMINLTPLEESTQFFEDILHRPIIHSIFNSIKDIHGLTTSQKEDVIHSIYKAHLSGPISFYSPL